MKNTKLQSCSKLPGERSLQLPNLEGLPMERRPGEADPTDDADVAAGESTIEISWTLSLSSKATCKTVENRYKLQTVLSDSEQYKWFYLSPSVPPFLQKFERVQFTDSAGPNFCELENLCLGNGLFLFSDDCLLERLHSRGRVLDGRVVDGRLFLSHFPVVSLFVEVTITSALLGHLAGLFWAGV